jgi:rhodanese-related sulfurtransferase
MAGQHRPLLFQYLEFCLPAQALSEPFGEGDWRMMIRSNFKLTLLVSLVAFLAASLAGGADGFTVIDKDQLKEELTKPDVIVIDVRATHDWDSSQWKIQGAQRQSPAEVKEWIDKYPKDKTIVLYCAWANEATSARVAQELASAGYKKVEVLKGGWNEWVLSQYPVEKK